MADHTGRTYAEVFPDAAGEFRSHVFDANGHELFKSSEGYVDRAHAADMIRSRFGPIPIEHLDAAPPD